MTFFYAGKFHRFLVYLIDFVLLSIVASFVFSGIFAALSIDTSTADSYYQLFVNELFNMAQGGGSEANLAYYLEQYAIHSLVDRLFSLLVLAIFIVAFLVVLPIFWKGQTLGRFLFHLVLLDKNGEKAKAKNFILREIVGTLIFYALFGGIGVIISLICVAVKNRSIVDIISGTHLCYKPEYISRFGVNPNANNTNTENVNEDLNNDFNSNLNNDSNDDYNNYNDNNIDADWHEVDDNQEDANSSNDDEDKYKII